MDEARAILARLWQDEGVSSTKADFPLWVLANYVRGHGGFGALQAHLPDLEAITLGATARALDSYEPAKGSLPSWLRLLIEQELGDYLKREHRNSTAGGHGRASCTVKDDEDQEGDGSRLDVMTGGVEQVERDVFEGWRRRVVLEAVKRLPERQAKAVILYYRLDGWPHKRTDARVGDELYVTAKAAEQLRRRGVEGLRAMGLPRELLDETPAVTWPPASRRASHRQARPVRLTPGPSTPGPEREWDHRKRPNPALGTVDLAPGEELPESA
jgi:DNA-directed RNA polymerase specialized sigma24 family protein